MHIYNIIALLLDRKDMFEHFKHYRLFLKDFTETNDPFLHYWLNVDVVQQQHFIVVAPTEYLRRQPGLFRLLQRQVFLVHLEAFQL